jgi:cytochrome c-type biogenesis protein CcmH/NrfG
VSVDAEQHETLEAERDFLLRSLDDLDAELLAGNIDPDTYRVLHDDYTARAAAVIIAIEAGAPAPGADASKVSPVWRFVTAAGIVVFAALAALLLANAIGQRKPGQTITGNAQAGGAAATGGSATPTTGLASALATARQAATATPNDYSARINYARLLMSSGDLPDAVKEFVAASKLDPSRPEPLAYSGWISALVARQVTDASTKQQLLDAATASIDGAIKADPSYPDAYAFEGIVLAQMKHEPCAGAAALQQFLVLAPSDNPMRNLVLSALSSAVQEGNCPKLATPNPSPTTQP